MAKKLTQYEIDCIARQLEKIIINPLTEENNTIINQTPDNLEMLKDIDKLLGLNNTIESLNNEIIELEVVRNRILDKYQGNHYSGQRDSVAWVEKKHYDFKQSKSILKHVPTSQELKDLIILNSNLELQEIIKLITDKFMQ